MLHSRNGSSFPTALAATTVGVMLVVGACTTDAPVAADMNATPEESTVVDAADSEVVAVWIGREGEVQVNGSTQPVDGVSEAVQPLYTPETVVSLEAHEAAPYAVVAAVQEELRRAGLFRVVFVTTATDAPGPALSEDELVENGLPLVLPEIDNPDLPDMRQVVARNPQNILFLEVLPSGLVATRRGSDPSVVEIAPEDVEALWRREVSENAKLIAFVETHPDAEYSHMYRVLGALRRADATRISLQTAE